MKLSGYKIRQDGKESFPLNTDRGSALTVLSNCAVNVRNKTLDLPLREPWAFSINSTTTKRNCDARKQHVHYKPKVAITPMR